MRFRLRGGRIAKYVRDLTGHCIDQRLRRQLTARHHIITDGQGFIREPIVDALVKALIPAA